MGRVEGSVPKGPPKVDTERDSPYFINMIRKSSVPESRRRGLLYLEKVLQRLEESQTVSSRCRTVNRRQNDSWFEKGNSNIVTLIAHTATLVSEPKCLS